MLISLILSVYITMCNIYMSPMRLLISHPVQYLIVIICCVFGYLLVGLD